MKIKMIANNALVAALYVGITFLTSSFAYLGIQFRIGEILLLLVFFRKDYSVGLILGCLIANLFSPLGVYDVVFGTLATALSVFCISKSKNLIIASLFPVIFNGLIVGLELYYVLELPFLINALTVALGELVVVTIFGTIIFTILRKKKYFMELIGANNNL